MSKVKRHTLNLKITGTEKTLADVLMILSAWPKVKTSVDDVTVQNKEGEFISLKPFGADCDFSKLIKDFVESEPKKASKGFVIYDGQKIEVKEFIPHEKACRKINLCSTSGESEGIWAYFDKDDLKKYDENVSGGIAIAILGNDSLMGPPWGTYIPVEFGDGVNRPVCNISKCHGDLIIYKGDVLK